MPLPGSFDPSVVNLFQISFMGQNDNYPTYSIDVYVSQDNAYSAATDPEIGVVYGSVASFTGGPFNVPAGGAHGGYNEFTNLSGYYVGFACNFSLDSVTEHITTTSFTVGKTPEPTTLILYGVGFAGAGLYRRMRRRK